MKKRINGVRKGRETELEYQKIMESRGFQCFKPRKKSRFEKAQDIFGEFDMICINKDEIRLIQIKASEYRKGINKLKTWKNHPDYVKKILAIRKRGGTWDETEV